MNKSFTIKYEVRCKLQNFFNKEMIVKNCMSEMHAKANSCKEKIDLRNIFGNGFPGDAFADMFGGKK